MVTRFFENGRRDSSFGQNGKTVVDTSTIWWGATAFQNNKIIIVGGLKNPINGDWLVCRLNNSIGADVPPFLSKKEIILFPNPGTFFQLRFNGYEEVVKISIYDAAGRLHHQQKAEVFDQSVVDVKTQLLASGVYFVVIHTAEGIVTKRFVRS